MLYMGIDYKYLTHSKLTGSYRVFKNMEELTKFHGVKEEIAIWSIIKNKKIGGNDKVTYGDDDFEFERTEIEIFDLEEMLFEANNFKKEHIKRMIRLAEKPFY